MSLRAYKTYLKSKSYSERTIHEDCLNTERFFKWLESEDQELITTTDLVDYIAYLQRKGISPRVINNRLLSIRKYYDYLKVEGTIASNPAENLKVKGAVKKVVVDPLDYSDLEELYSAYSTYKNQQIEKLKETGLNRASRTCSSVALKRKVMLGFMVFQGLQSGELKRLEINHINEDEGTIYIAGSKKSKSRQLELRSTQMRPLFKYLDYLQERQASLLFEGNVNNQLFQLIQELRGINEKVQDTTHIRASVIMHWLKLHGKRRVQYMIGHKWISSTEHYELQDLEALTNLLEKHHPLSGSY